MLARGIISASLCIVVIGNSYFHFIFYATNNLMLYVGLHFTMAPARLAPNSTSCFEHEVFRKSSCDLTCVERRNCTTNHKGCFCPDELVRDALSNFCIAPELCPTAVSGRELRTNCNNEICNSICTLKKFIGGFCNGESCECNEFDKEGCSATCSSFGAPGLLCDDKSCTCGLCDSEICQNFCRTKGHPITGGSCSHNSATCLCVDESVKCGSSDCLTYNLYTTGRMMKCRDSLKSCFNNATAILLPCQTDDQSAAVCTYICMSTGRGKGICTDKGCCSCQGSVSTPICSK